MQIADIQFFTEIPEPATASLVAMMGLALAAATRRRG
jgi:MYXO-CTERM domain-containing protein